MKILLLEEQLWYYGCSGHNKLSRRIGLRRWSVTVDDEALPMIIRLESRRCPMFVVVSLGATDVDLTKMI